MRIVCPSSERSLRNTNSDFVSEQPRFLCTEWESTHTKLWVMYKDKSRDMSMLVLTGIEFILFTVALFWICDEHRVYIIKMFLLLQNFCLQKPRPSALYTATTARKLGVLGRGQNLEDGICHIFNVKQHKTAECFV